MKERNLRIFDDKSFEDSVYSIQHMASWSTEFWCKAFVVLVLLFGEESLPALSCISIWQYEYVYIS